MKGKKSTSCVFLKHDSKKRPMRVEHKVTLDRTEMNNIRQICGLSVKQRKKMHSCVDVARTDDAKWIKSWRKRVNTVDQHPMMTQTDGVNRI